MDTQIVLEALDLQNESDSMPTIELLNLIKDSGGRLGILDITLNEISNAIKFAIENFDKFNSVTTINDACLRKNKGKSWLIHLNGELPDYLRENLGVGIESIPQNKINKYKKSKDVIKLQSQRLKKSSAEHDVFAYLYIRDRRKVAVRSIQKAKYWFLSANKNLYNFNGDYFTKYDIGDIMLPDVLTSLLWLKNPKLIDRIIKVGINKLIAQTISEELPSKELIQDFDQNIKKYSDITSNDYDIIISAMVEESANYIRKINNLALEEDKTKFNTELLFLVDKGKKRIEAHKKQKKQLMDKEKVLEKSKKSLKERLKTVNSELGTYKEIHKSDKSQIASLQHIVEKQNFTSFKIKKLLSWLLVFVVLYLLTTFAFYQLSFLKKLLTWISGLGGLWTVISIIIEIAKFKTKKKIN